MTHRIGKDQYTPLWCVRCRKYHTISVINVSIGEYVVSCDADHAMDEFRLVINSTEESTDGTRSTS